MTLTTAEDLEELAGLSDVEFFEWRETTRKSLLDHGDARLSELYEWSNAELTERARRSWQRGGT